jgi:2-polyprenyl-3-methyl-5-hydroxy-6-metoxy-1,4-benzoquinol methylase
MINSAQANITNENIKLIQTDCLDALTNYPKFDIVTVSEALHWFPVQDFIKHCAKNLLTS